MCENVSLRGYVGKSRSLQNLPRDFDQSNALISPASGHVLSDVARITACVDVTLATVGTQTPSTFTSNAAEFVKLDFRLWANSTRYRLRCFVATLIIKNRFLGWNSCMYDMVFYHSSAENIKLRTDESTSTKRVLYIRQKVRCRGWTGAYSRDWGLFLDTSVAFGTWPSWLWRWSVSSCDGLWCRTQNPGAAHSEVMQTLSALYKSSKEWIYNKYLYRVCRRHA